MTRQPDFSTASRSAHPPLWGGAWLVAGALAVLAASYQALGARGEASAAAARLAEVSREVAALSSKRAALVARALVPGGEPLPAAEAPPARILADLAALLPPDVRLDRLAIDYQAGGALELVVVARNAAAWDLLLERLDRSPRIHEVAPGPESRASEVRNLVRARWSAAP